MVSRAVAIGAHAVALTGSTARDRRTSISDLDYHVVGQRPKVDDLPGDVDVYAGDPSHFWEIEMGDRDAAQSEVRAALTSAARGLLLEGGAFPLARSELPAQLRSLGHDRLASSLEATIHGEPPLTELERSLAALPPRRSGQNPSRDGKVIVT